jgi:hypothetical protein
MYHISRPGFYFSYLNGVYRVITDFHNSGLDPAAIQRGQYGGNPNDPGPRTAGGAQTWEQYLANAYAMDPSIRNAIDTRNNVQPAPVAPPAASPDSRQASPDRSYPDFYIPQYYWPVHFRPNLSDRQKNTIYHMLDTRMNEKSPLNETDAKNYARAIGQPDAWKNYVGKLPGRLWG